MTDQEVYKETTVTIESPLLDEEVQDQIKDAAQDVVDESAQAAQERAEEAGKQALDKAKELAEGAKPVVMGAVKTLRQAIQDAVPVVTDPDITDLLFQRLQFCLRLPV